MARIDYQHIEAVINLAKAAALLEQPASTLVNSILPDLKLTDKEIQLFAALGKARDLKGLKTDEMNFTIDIEDKGKAERAVDIHFSNTNWGRTGSREHSALVENIVQAVQDAFPAGNSGPIKGSLTVGWQNYDTGAIGSHDNGNLQAVPVSDALAAVETVNKTMEKMAAARRAHAEKSTGVA